MSDPIATENKILALKKRYISSLPEKISAIIEIWETYKQAGKVTDKSLESGLHKLAGSAGMYDVAELGAYARSLEISIAELSPELTESGISEIDSKLSQLNLLATALGNE